MRCGLGQVRDWQMVTKTESALQPWSLPRMWTNLSFHSCPRARGRPMLPQPAGSSCLPWVRLTGGLSWSWLLGSQPVLPPRREEGCLPVLGKLLGKRRHFQCCPMLPGREEGIRSLPGFPQNSPAHWFQPCPAPPWLRHRPSSPSDQESREAWRKEL